MNRTATIALLAAFAAGPALAQATVEEDADVIVVEPEATEAEPMASDEIVTDPAVTDDVEILEGADAEVVEEPAVTEDATVVEDAEVVEAEAVEAEPMGEMAELIRTRDITGGTVYSTGAEGYDEARWTASDPMTTAQTGTYETYGYDENYDNIGEIEDIVLDRSGQMVGIVAEVGGFLGIGDHHVMLPVEDVRLVPVDDSEYSYVTRYTEEQLEGLPDVDEGPLD